MHNSQESIYYAYVSPNLLIRIYLCTLINIIFSCFVAGMLASRNHTMSYLEILTIIFMHCSMQPVQVCNVLSYTFFYKKLRFWVQPQVAYDFYHLQPQVAKELLLGWIPPPVVLLGLRGIPPMYQIHFHVIKQMCNLNTIVIFFITYILLLLTFIVLKKEFDTWC